MTSNNGWEKVSRTNALVVAMFLGVAVAFVFVPFLGISSAIPAPPSLFSWARSNGLLEPTLFAWETFVVGGIGLALPALAAMILLCLAYPMNRRIVALSCAGGILLGHYLFVPWMYLESPLLALDRRWWSLGQELSLIIVVGIICAWQWASRTTPR